MRVCRECFACRVCLICSHFAFGERADTPGSRQIGVQSCTPTLTTFLSAIPSQVRVAMVVLISGVVCASNSANREASARRTVRVLVNACCKRRLRLARMSPRTHVPLYTRCLSTPDDHEENSAEARAGRQGSGLWRTGTACIFESSVWSVACTVILAVYGFLKILCLLIFQLLQKIKDAEAMRTGTLKAIFLTTSPDLKDPNAWEVLARSAREKCSCKRKCMQQTLCGIGDNASQSLALVCVFMCVTNTLATLQHVRDVLTISCACLSLCVCLFGALYVCWCVSV